MSEGAHIVLPDLQRIGKYDVLERIADGGFATLYRGRDPFLKRLVAIKVCASEDPELRSQFLREAEIAGNLDHPSIVRTFDFGFDPVGPYLVQEYLQGEDLSALIVQRAPLSARRKLDLLVQIAEGLAYSHQRRVLHLDVKPGNIRVLGRRHAKILDFGIARLSTDDAPAPSGMIGTAGYLPPEQVMSRAVDARSDIFSFGALAYELLTYTRPYAGGTIQDLLRRVLVGEPEPLTRYWPACDEALANLVGRCLRREPAGRYPSFTVLLPELIAIRDGYPDTSEVELAASTPAIPSDAEADRMESAALASSQALAASDAAAPMAPVEPSPADTNPVGNVDPAIAKRRLQAATRRTLMAGLAAAAAVIVIALAVFLPSHEPTVSAEPVTDLVVPPSASGPAPGLLVVTAAPWGLVSRLVGADGEAVTLPVDRMTPVRLWVEPGLYRAELSLAGGAVALCEVEVATGGTSRCVAEPVDAAAVPERTDYFKEMGWFR